MDVPLVLVISVPLLLIFIVVFSIVMFHSLNETIEQYKILWETERHRKRTVSHAELTEFVNQANALGWKLPPTTAKRFDTTTEKLLTLATDSRTNTNEAKNAALQACKRLVKQK